MDGLHLRFFGHFQATLNNIPLPITSHKTWAILAWLAFHPDRPQSRDAIATLLWPEHPKPLPTLRQALSRLRRQIPAHLEVTRTTVALVGTWASDIGRFQHALAGEDWERVASEYHGEFLSVITAESLQFDEWLLLKREWFQREYLRALHALTERHFQNNDYTKAYQTAWRRGEIDRFDEAAQRDIMRALALQGRRNDALAHYETVRDLLLAELAVDPAASTTELRHQIAKGTLPDPTTQPTAHKRHNLPRQNTPFVGRRDLLEQLIRQLSNPNCRLLTLQGMGGMGKTRLAVELGQRMLARRAVWFVPLAPVEQGAADADIVQAIAGALEIVFPDSVRETAERLRFLIGRLQTNPTLLILDNYEQIVAQTLPIITLLNGLPELKIVVTSREALGLQAEWLIDVVGLPDAEAHELFMAAARRISAEFQPTSAIHTIIKQVAGMPLAIELAAGWVRQFSCAEIAAQIQSDINFLAAQRADVPERQRSMRAVFNYSWRLLDESQRDLLRRLAIFPNHFSMAAVQAICGAEVDQLRALTTHSLVQRVGEQRFGFHPALRQFSAEKLTQEHTQLEQRFRTHYLTTLSQINQIDFADVIAYLHVEYANVLQAWRLAAQAVDDSLLQASKVPFFNYIQRMGERVAGEALLRETIRLLDGKAADETNAHLYCELAGFSFGLGLYDQGLEAAEVAYRAAQSAENHWLSGKSAYYTGELYRRTSRFEQALAHFQLALKHVEGRNHLIVEAESLMGTSNIFRYQNRKDEAITAARKSVALSQIINNPAITRITHTVLAMCHEDIGELEQGLHYHQQALAAAQSLGNQHTIALCHCNLIEVLIMLNRYAEAESAGVTGLEIVSNVDNVHVEALLNTHLADVRSAQFRFDLARDGYAAAQKTFVATKNPTRIAGILRRQAIVALRRGAWMAAQHLFQTAIERYEEIGQVRRLAETVALKGVATWRLAAFEQAVEYAEQALQLSDNTHSQAIAYDVIGRIALAKNDYTNAEIALEKASALHSEARQMNLAVESRAAWISARHAQNKDVRDHHALLVNHLKTAHLFGTLDPIGVYVACLEVEFSAELAHAANNLLAQTAAAIDDPFERHDYLHHIPSHVAIRNLCASL